MTEQTTQILSAEDTGKPARDKKTLVRFVGFAFACMVVFTLIWTKITPWTSYPVAVVSHFALEQVAPMWVRGVNKQPGKIEVETSVNVVVPNTGGRVADVYVEADPGRYAFGLPIFLALIAAAYAAKRAPGRIQKAVTGYLLLLPIQAFSLVMYLLMQVIVAANLDIRTLRVDTWQVESIVFGYQVGVLVLPTLAPVLIWLLLDRKFFADVIVNGWKQSMAGKSPRAARR